jgi:iron complex outermembrane recepter protein
LVFIDRRSRAVFRRVFMSRSALLRGVSACAITLLASSLTATAQQNLPRIDVGGQHHRTRAHAPRHAARATRPAPAQPVAARPAEPITGGEGGLRAGDMPGSGDRATGYRAETATAAKLDAPILKTPIAVQVVQRQTLDDQGAISVQDGAIYNVSSVSPAPNGISSFQTLTIRGFATTSITGFGMSQTYRNGLMQPFWINPNTSNVQSIEVVKGPGAVLYGRVEPGGLVDLVIKRPLETPYYSIEQQIGSFDLTRTTVEATGPITKDKTWLYRVTGNYSYANSFVNFANDQEGFGAATITYHPDERLKVNLDLEYQDSMGVDNGPNFPAFGNRPAPISIKTYLEDPMETVPNPDHYIRRFVAYDWTYKLDPDWSITNRFSYANARRLAAGMFASCFSDLPYPVQSGNSCTGSNVQTPGTMVNGNIWGTAQLRSLSNSIDLKGHFTTGPLDHAALFGFDHMMSSSVGHNQFINNAQPNLAFLPRFNIFAPNYFSGLPLEALTKPTNGFSLIKKQDWGGMYAQDLISFFDDRVHLLVGGRYDWAAATSGTGSTQGGSSYDSSLFIAFANARSISDAAFSPRVGLVVQPMPWLSLYGNFTQGFGLNNGLNQATRQPLGAQKSEQFEAGIKTEFFDKRLTATAAFYDIRKQNVAQANNATLGLYDTLDARSIGVELDITGKLNDNWSVIANFSHTEARVTKGSPYNLADPLDLVNQKPLEGRRLPGVPDNMGNVWIKYDGDGALFGFSSAVGMSRVGVAQGDPANSFQMPAYTLLRGMLAYRFPVGATHVTAQINADNLLDDRYFYGTTSFTNRYSMTPGTPRSFLGSLRVEF